MSAGGTTFNSFFLPIFPPTWIIFPFWLVRALPDVLYQIPLALVVLVCSLTPSHLWYAPVVQTYGTGGDDSGSTGSGSIGSNRTGSHV